MDTDEPVATGEPGTPVALDAREELPMTPPPLAVDEALAPPGLPPLPMPSYMAIPVVVAPPSPPAPRKHAGIPFLIALTLLSLIADLATKGWAKARLDGYDSLAHGVKRVGIWKDHFEFVFARNPGGAWSFLRSLPDSLRRPFFLVVSAGAIVFIITIYQRIYDDQRAMKWGLPLALGGAMGNLADRIRYGWVVDFIDTSMKWGGRDHHWPTFNVADVAIVIGVGLMAMDMLRARTVPLRDDAHEPHEPPISARPADLPG